MRCWWGSSAGTWETLARRNVETSKRPNVENRNRKEKIEKASRGYNEASGSLRSFGPQKARPSG